MNNYNNKLIKNKIIKNFIKIKNKNFKLLNNNVNKKLKIQFYKIQKYKNKIKIQKKI